MRQWSNLHHGGGGQGKIVLQVTKSRQWSTNEASGSMCVSLQYCDPLPYICIVYSPRPPTVLHSIITRLHHVRGGLKFVWPDTVWKSTSASTPSVVGFRAQCGLGMRLLTVHKNSAWSQGFQEITVLFISIFVLTCACHARQPQSSEHDCIYTLVKCLPQHHYHKYQVST